MVQRTLNALLGLLAFTAWGVLPPPAAAKSWSGPEWNLHASALSTSNLFPGSADTGPDRGLEAEATLGGGLRAARGLKLGFEGHAGGDAWSRFENARYGWVGGSLNARRGGAQLRLESEWTPRRVKFGDESGDAVFRRLEWRVGARQALSGALRLRLEGRFRNDDYVTAFDLRDERARAAYGQIAWQPSGAWSVRGDYYAERADAVGAKYDQDEHWAGGGLGWSGARWRLEGSLRSGVRRYPNATRFDSNFRRRDQWMDLGGEAGRRLRERLDLEAGAGLLDQTSSRADRTYHVLTFHLGLEWNGARP